MKKCTHFTVHTGLRHCYSAVLWKPREHFIGMHTGERKIFVVFVLNLKLQNRIF